MNSDNQPHSQADLIFFQFAAQASGMMSFASLVHIAHYLMQTSQVEGEVVEFGCNMGQTSVFMAKIASKRVWVYDSFQGMPEPLPTEEVNREVFKGGMMKVSPEVVQKNFARAAVECVLVAKFFKDVTPAELPDKIAFAHLDGDLYESTRDSLRLVWPRLSPGGAILVHDYGWCELSGVKQAVDEFFADKLERPMLLKGGGVWPLWQCVIIKS